MKKLKKQDDDQIDERALDSPVKLRQKFRVLCQCGYVVLKADIFPGYRVKLNGGEFQRIGKGFHQRGEKNKEHTHEKWTYEQIASVIPFSHQAAGPSGRAAMITCAHRIPFLLLSIRSHTKSPFRLSYTLQ